MNKEVNFEIAKLLKEKGFDEVCQQWYSVEGGLYHQDEFNNNRGFIPVCECEAPTIAEVVMWLYEKHGIWISTLQHTKNGKGVYFESFLNAITFSGYDSPTEAYETAILYTLKNIIK